MPPDGDPRLHLQARLRPLLTLPARLFRWLQAARRWAYRYELRESAEVETPVISVGALLTGGAGKTPFVVHVARKLADRRVAILSRGYGGRYKGHSQVDAHTDPLHCGDEPAMLARSDCGDVWVSRKRVMMAAILAARYDLFLLDDGYQHLHLKRDCNICLVPDLPIDQVLPAGLWREGPEALRDADYVVAVDRVPAWLSDFYAGPVGLVKFVPAAWHSDSAATELPERVFAFCGIARTERFFDSLQGFDVRGTLSYPDHYDYSTDDLARIWRRAHDAGAEGLVTTAKDAIRIRHKPADLPLFWRDVEVEWQSGEEEFDALVRSLVTRKLASRDE